MTRVRLVLAPLLVVSMSCESETAPPSSAGASPPSAPAEAPEASAQLVEAADETKADETKADEAKADQPSSAGIGSIVAGAMSAGEAAPVEPPGEPGVSRMTIPTGAPADVAAAPPTATTTASGLAYRVLSRGSGSVSPGPTDEVEVHYSGWTTDGKEFDSSIRRGKTAKFGLDKVIPGWTEGLQLMVEGEITRFWIPENLAYGGKPGRPAGMLVFDVELIGVVKKPAPPAAPADVAAPPATATVTKSGLAYEVLTPGTGTIHPGPTSRVEVHYTGWTTDGKMFDSSITRGKTTTFPLNAVIPGWTEGLQLMVVGEKTRFWIPEDLAYAGKPGRPAGMLVFDVELVSLP